MTTYVEPDTEPESESDPIRMQRSRRNHTAQFKSEVAIAAITSGSSLSALGARFGVHPKMVARWKAQFIKGAPAAFSNDALPLGSSLPQRGNGRNRVTIRRQREIKFIVRGLQMALDSVQRNQLIDPSDPVPIGRQAELLSLPRSTVYFRRRKG